MVGLGLDSDSFLNPSLEKVQGSLAVFDWFRRQEIEFSTEFIEETFLIVISKDVLAYLK